MDWIRRFFSSPVFEDEEKTRVARLTDAMLNVFFGASLAAALFMFITSRATFLSDWASLGIFGIVLIATLLMRFVLRLGLVRTVSSLLVLVLFAIITFALYIFGGISNSTTIGYILCIVITSLLLGGRAALASIFLSVVAISVIWYAGYLGIIKSPSEETPIFDLLANGTVFIISGVLLYYAVNSLAQALERARRNEQAQIEANRALEALKATLEQQVTERTRDLERRTNYLQAAAQIGHATTSILNIDQLLRQAVESIQERFNLYHSAIFMLDATGRWADYRAGTDEAGRVLAEQGLRLEVGGRSMVGKCIAQNQGQISQDVRTETERVGHSLLAATRSEVALPLVARGRVIGALSAQSSLVGAFDQDAVAALQTLADQVATALDNARLLAESQTALEAERLAYGEVGRAAWANLLRTGLAQGYTYANDQVLPIVEAAPPETDAALRQGQSIITPPPDPTQGGPVLAIPIRVRGQVIGAVDLRKGSSHDQWTEQEMALLETLAEQLGVALESARLYQDTQRRAASEQITGQVAARMRESLDVDAVLQTAIREIGQSLNLTEVEIRLRGEA